MKKTLRALSLVLVLMLALSAFAFAEGTKTYNGIDVSEHVDITLIYLGDPQTDTDKILGLLNEKLEEDLNVTLHLENMPLSDYTLKYALRFQDGDPFDIIYTCTWAYYAETATKGAFVEITDEVLEKYMPLAKEYEAPYAWEQAKVDGKIYFMPANLTAPAKNGAVVIRGDLREKYGLGELETFDDLEEYLKCVAEDDESGVTFPYYNDASTFSNYLFGMLYQGVNQYVGIGDYFAWHYTDGSAPAADELFYRYGTEEYKEFAKKMKEWCDMGFWSKNAANDTTDNKEAFLAGNSAMHVSNLGTVGVTAKAMYADHPEWQPEVYDLGTTDLPLKGTYTGDGYAVTTLSENPERAFMVLDTIKFNKDYYNLMRLGIEGYHYVDEGNGLRSTTEHSADYAFGHALSWGFKNTMFELTDINQWAQQTEIANDWEANWIQNPISNFSFDLSNLQNEVAAMSNVATKYIQVLNLGLVDDVDATWDAMMAEAEAAGIETMQDELVSQYEAFIERMGW